MRLFDTLSGSLVELPPRPGPVRMYVCGPTVYARAHVGNARPFIFGMWLRSWLHASGYEVTLVHNITDVNDKIYAAAPGASAELARKATDWYLEDTADLGLGMPDRLPRVSELVPEIIAFIGELEARGFAYASGGDVYFRVSSFPDYGRLSGQRPDRLEDSEPSALKHDPRDFALWKATKVGEDTSWDSPWGPGRPGWHIECSVMAEQTLGTAFEIHGGGLDLLFPHHENERAQSCVLGHPFAQIWAHNGLLELTERKMSKSEGNIATLRDVLDRWGREVLLVYFLGGHWRKPIDFSDELLSQAAAQAEGLREVFRGPSRPAPEQAWADFSRALDDDFNTPAALAVLHGWRDHELLLRALEVFSLGSLEAAEDAPAPVRALAEQRRAARAARDFARADELRLRLEESGWEMRDGESGAYRLVRRT
jgi:cysteinyl-tRNA synthetase